MSIKLTLVPVAEQRANAESTEEEPVDLMAALRTSPPESKKEASQPMSNDPITPRELDATIKALDASWSARFEVIGAKFDASITRLMEIADDSKEASKEASKVARAEGLSTRWTFAAVVAAAVAICVTVVSLEPAFFESGRNVGALIEAVNSSVKALAQHLEGGSSSRLAEKPSSSR